jgi:hypothetical protein
VPPRLLASDTNDMLFVEEKVEKDRKRGLKRFECRAFFVTLPSKRWRNYSDSAKKEMSFFVLLSTCRNFAFESSDNIN